ncbi:hypothetical protein ACMBCM_04510 [Spiroplasma sp. K1]
MTFFIFFEKKIKKENFSLKKIYFIFKKYSHNSVIYIYIYIYIYI